MQKNFFKRAFYALTAVLFAVNVNAQVDTAFWFVVPYVNIHHGLQEPSNYGGAKPLFFKYSTLNEPATITISQPAYNGGVGRVLHTKTLPPNSTDYFEIDDAEKFEIMVSPNGNVVEDKGIYIHSTAQITVYYENATVQNPDLFALKGSNALGELFYTPFQTLWPNDPKHNANQDDPVYQYDSENREGLVSGSVGDANSIWQVPDSAFSAFDIVATENRTTVRITPTTDIVGHPKGVPFEVRLNKGQTYTARALRQGVLGNPVDENGYSHWRCSMDNYCWGWRVTDNKYEDNLSGSKVEVISGGKVAVTLKDDSIFENDEENSFSGGCEDFIGDQLVPVDLIGNEYLVMKGALVPSDVKEHVFIVGVEGGTTVTISGLDANGTVSRSQVVSLGEGETYAYSICSGDTDGSCNKITHIQSDKNVYVLHTSGYLCELAAAVLPPVNLCTGSRQVGFTRTYGGIGDEVVVDSDNKLRRFFMNVMVRQGEGNVDGFQIFTNGAFDEGATSALTGVNGANFIPIAGTDWSVASVEFDNYTMTNGAHLIKNTNTLFHMAFVNSTSNNFGQGFVLTGSEYGYFSNYDENIPDAYVYDPRNPNLRRDTLIVDVTNNNGAQFRAEGGVSYTWERFEFNKQEADVLPWTNLDEGLLQEARDGEVVTVDGVAIADSGVYRVFVTIKNDCFSSVNGGVHFKDTLYVIVKRLPDFPSLTDTVCDTDPDPVVFRSEHYTLNHLYDTIMLEHGKEGYYVEGWYTSHLAQDIIISNFEDLSLTVSDTYNSSATVVSNPKVLGNSSSSVLYMLKNDNQGAIDEERDSYYVDLLLDESVDLNKGYEFSFKYLFDGGVSTNTSNHYVSATLIGPGITSESNEINIPSSLITTPQWAIETVTFDQDTTKSGFTHLRLKFEAAFDFTSNLGFYVDDIEYNSKDHYEIISDSTDYVFTQELTYVYARIKDVNSASYDNYVEQSIFMNDIGREKRDKVFPNICRPQTDTLCNIDLSQFKYSIGGSITSTKDWFRDANLTDSIEDIHNVCAMDSTIFYARINDHCGRVGAVIYDIVPLPGLDVDETLKKTVCADKDLVDAAVVDFTKYHNEFVVNDEYPWQFTWYSDEARTKLLPDNTAITVNDGDVFYGMVNKNGRFFCSEHIEMSFTVTPAVPDTLSIADMCLNAGAIDFTNNQLGSDLTFAGDGFTGNVFDPLLAGVGSHQITMTYTNSGCSWDYSYTAVVLDTPHVSLVPEPLDSTIFVQLGNDTVVDATVTGGTPFGTGDKYKYSWSSVPADKFLNHHTTEDLTTVEMVEYVEYTFVATDALGCTATRVVPIDIKGLPLSYLEIVKPAICVGEEATLTAKLTGGAGDFEITWKYVGSDEVIASEFIGRARSHSITILPEDTVDIYIEVVDHLDFDRKIDTTVTQIVNPNPEINVEGGNFLNICQYAPAEINGGVVGGNLAYIHNWTGDTQILKATDEAVPSVHSDLAVGIYNLHYKVTDANSCSDEADVEISINQNPVIEPPYNYEVCDGLSVDLAVVVTGTEDNVYKWEADNAALGLLSATDVSQPVFKSSGAGRIVYQFSAVNALNCADTVEVAVDVHPKPIITNFNDTVGCVDDPINISIGVESGTPDFDVNWNDDRFAPDAFETVFTSSFADDFAAEVYVNDAHNCKDTAIAQIVINENPTNLVPNEITVCSRYDNVIDVTDDPNAVVSWSGDVSIIKDSSNPLVVTINAEQHGSYQLHYIIMNGNNCDSEGTLTIKVLESPYYAAKDTSYCVGREDTLFTTSLNDVVSKYKWSLRDGGDGSLTGLGQNAKFVSGTAGVNYVDMVAIALDYSQCTDTVTFEVNVYDNPIVTITNNAGFLPYGMDDGVVATSIVKETVGAYKYAWSGVVDSDPDSLKSTADLHYFDFLDPVTVQVRMFDANYCSDTAEISFFTRDDVITVDDVSLCLRDSISRMSDVRPTSVDFGVSYSYEWRTINGLIVSSKKDWDIPLTKNETYVLTVDNGYVSASDTFNVFVYADPTIDIVATSMFNGSTELFFTGVDIKLESNVYDSIGVENLNTEWIVGRYENNERIDTVMQANGESTILPAQYTSGYYYVQFSTKQNNEAACWAESEKIIYIDLSDEIIIDPFGICVGDTVLFTATPHVDYILWEVRNVEFEPIGVFRGDSVRGIVKNSDTVYVRAYADSQTSLSTPLLEDYYQVIAYDYPKTHIVGADQVCENSTELYQLSENLAASPINVLDQMKINWDLLASQKTAENTVDSNLITVREDAHVDELISDIAFLDDQIVMNDTAMILWKVEDVDTVLLTVNNHGCVLIDTLVVTVNPNPEPMFDFYEAVSKTKEEIYIGKEIVFENMSDSTNNFYEIEHFDYYWDFIGEDIYTSREKDPVYNYREIGSFNVQLYIINNETGCFGKYVVPVEVKVNPECYMNYPTGFEPAHENPAYTVFKHSKAVGVLERDFSFRVFNKWGDMLFETNALTEAWDGYFNGKLMNQDTYIFHVEYTCENGEKKQYMYEGGNPNNSVILVR